jgi:uncharacterized membrane protein (DUF106 family)
MQVAVIVAGIIVGVAIIVAAIYFFGQRLMLQLSAANAEHRKNNKSCSRRLCAASKKNSKIPAKTPVI